MANAFTGTGQITNAVQTAYDRYFEMALRDVVWVRDVADKRPEQQAMPGSSVVFQIYADLATATTPLTETVDPDSVSISNTGTVTVTLNEYGNAALVTRKLELFSLSDVDPAIADIVARNMVDSLDVVAMTTLRQGTNVVYSAAGAVDLTGPTNTVGGATDILSAALARYITAELRTNKAVPRRGELFVSYIHPEVSHDLRAATGAGSWRIPHEYNSNEAIWNGEIGTFEGAFYVESPRLYNATDGQTSQRVYRTLYMGKQALAEAVAEEPHMVFGPVTDKLMRHRPIGWYGVLGWARYREASLFRAESSSSIRLT
jgi:N4-gp56 family major capsid protein